MPAAGSVATVNPANRTGALKVMLVPNVEPIVMAVVLPVSPPVPMLIVLVEPEAVAPAWMRVVWLPVARPSVMVAVALVPPIRIGPLVWLLPRPIVFPPPVIVKVELNVAEPATRKLSAPNAKRSVAVTLVPATGSTKYVP